jgi:hypothetical protein
MAFHHADRCSEQNRFLEPWAELDIVIAKINKASSVA